MFKGVILYVCRAFFVDYRNCDGFAIDDVSFAEMNQDAQRDASNSHYLEMILRRLCTLFGIEKLPFSLSFSLSARARTILLL